MRQHAHAASTSEPLDPFGAMADRLAHTDAHALYLNSAVEAANEISHEMGEYLPPEIAPHLVVDKGQDDVIIGFTTSAVPDAQNWEYGGIRGNGHGYMAMSEKALAAQASGIAAIQIATAVTG